MPDYAIIRVERIRRFVDAENATRHGLRVDRGAHYDRARTGQNQHWYRGCVSDCPVDWTSAIKETAEALGRAISKKARQ